MLSTSLQYAKILIDLTFKNTNMAATPKHRRSKQKARTTKASDRYDKLITLARKVKKKGGALFQINKQGKPYKSHTVGENNKVYKEIKILK